MQDDAKGFAQHIEAIAPLITCCSSQYFISTARLDSPSAGFLMPGTMKGEVNRNACWQLPQEGVAIQRKLQIDGIGCDQVSLLKSRAASLQALRQ
jgi:hypothetical protein